jgi:hypothetical protein
LVGSDERDTLSAARSPSQFRISERIVAIRETVQAS